MTFNPIFRGEPKLLNINGTRLNVYYSDWNHQKELPTILLIHGTIAHWLDWKYQIAFLEKYANIIAFDIRGHGKSDLGGGFDIDIIIRDIHGILDFLKIDKCIIGGHSFGGAMAQIFARRFNRKVEGLILVDSPYRCEAQWDDRLVEVLPDYIAKKIFFSNNLLGRYIARKTFLSPSTSKEIVNEYLDDHRESMKNYSPKTFKCFKCLFGFNSAGWLHSLTMPALVVIGKDDKIIPIVEAEKLHQLLPYSRLVKLDSGHLPMYEDYTGLNRAIKELLDSMK